MRKIVYYVAVSLDGYISGLDNDVSLFATGGKGVETYLEELKSFDTVIMGRKTYEFGYDYGIIPGQLAYPHMEHFIFSNSLSIKNPDSKLHIEPLEIQKITQLKNQAGSDIYLCGGGQFASWLLEHNEIDILKLKVNPIILGTGVKLFGESKKAFKLTFIDKQLFDNGFMIITYAFK
jgi:dihydrofolate reductase